MIKLLKGIVLLLVAIILFIPLMLWGIVETTIDIFYKKRFSGGLRALGDIYKMFAVIVDVMGNVICKVPFNRILIQPSGYKFGSRFDTISYALGRNYIDGTLKGSGRFLVNLLDKFEKDHVLIAVKLRDRNNTNK